MAWTAPRTWTDGELVTAAIMNPHVRDNLLAVGPHFIARKTADQSVTSSTAFVSDTHLLTPSIPANEVWAFDLRLLWTASTAGDIKISWSIPTGGRVTSTLYWQDSSGSASKQGFDLTTTDGANMNFQVNVTSTQEYLPISGVIRNGANAGAYTLRWAQVTSDGTATTLFTNSSLWAVKLA